MNDLEREFLQIGLMRGGILFLTPAQAMQMVQRACESGIPVLGLDGFFLRPGETQPSMNDSIDFSTHPTFDSWDQAKTFRDRYAGSPMYFEVVLG